MKDSKPFLGSSNSARISQIIQQQPHAVLIVGRDFANHSSVASYIATQIAKSNDVVSLDAPSIDEVRALFTHTRTKSNSSTDKRVVVVQNLGAVKHEAQNALLKQLEEPNAGVHYVLATQTEAHILSTIRSRCTVLSLAIPPKNDYLKAHSEHTPQEVQAALFASGGSYPQFVEYLNEPGASTATQAKEIIRLSPYERMKYTSGYEKNRPDAIALVGSMANIYHLLLQRASGNAEMVNRLDLCLETQAKIAQNGNIKLLLARLFATV